MTDRDSSSALRCNAGIGGCAMSCRESVCEPKDGSGGGAAAKQRKISSLILAGGLQHC
jgi:hypothetical protein